MFGAVLALVLAASPAPARTAPASSSCPTERTRLIEESNFVFPDGAHATHQRVRFLIDVGSDGRIRRSALVESSGDASVDAAAAKAIAEFRYGPPSYACVAMSTIASQWWDIPPDALAPSSPSPAPSPASASTAAACGTPFVRPMMVPLPPHRETPGTVAADVSLDAQARVTAVQLVQSSGHPKTDYAGTVAARNARYVFERQLGCAPAPTVYRMELTFR
jgi:TonB family protein